MTDPAGFTPVERAEFEATTAAYRAVLDWIDADPGRDLVGCTPAMVADTAIAAYRKAGAGGQYAGNMLTGALETFALNESALADPAPVRPGVEDLTTDWHQALCNAAFAEDVNGVFPYPRDEDDWGIVLAALEEVRHLLNQWWPWPDEVSEPVDD